MDINFDNIKIIDSYKNFVMLQYNQNTILYSYSELLAIYNKDLTILKNNRTQTNNKHLKIFQKVLDKQKKQRAIIRT
jgi:hypothetical protein